MRRHHGGKGKGLFHTLPPAPPQFVTQRGRFQQPQQIARQSFGISSRTQQAAVPVIQQVGNPPHLCGAHRQTAGHGFQDDIGLSFANRRQRKNPCAVIPGTNIRRARREQDAVTRRRSRRYGLQFRFARAVAHKSQHGIGMTLAHQRQRPEQGFMVLVSGQPRHTKYFR